MKKVTAYKPSGPNSPLETDMKRAYAWELMSIVNPVDRTDYPLSFSAALVILERFLDISDKLKEYEVNLNEQV